MTRNLGGSIGIAGLSTVLLEREKFHSNRLGDAITATNLTGRAWMHSTTNYLVVHGVNATAAHADAIVLLGQAVRREAYICAYNDDFLLLGLMLIAGGLLVCLIRKSAAPNLKGAN
jgi:DHA2 family multidrug resistance protein